uniref:Uncharacterized protein n=1 Tax=Wuchereria bancrofti TaxID=6293 RepID=A0AAF5PYK4_WUCBA
MLFRELSTNYSMRNDRNVASKCCCFVSPSGRYVASISRIEVFDSRPIETHFYNYNFIIFDFILDTTIEYNSTCGPFKRFHRFYFLNDTTGILVDFSRNNGTITQNIIQFSHVNHTVTCEYGRIWNFDVDDMLYETDDTHLICTTELMKYKNITYLPLLGEKDYLSEIFVRLIPANPFHSNNFTIPMLEINEQNAFKNKIQMNDGEILQATNLCTDTFCYPLINETSLYFIVRLRTNPQSDRQTCVAMLKFDFKNYFENNFSSTAKITTNLLPLQWKLSLTEKFSLRPRYVRIMAQQGPIVLLRTFIFVPERKWILINLNTMIMSPLKFENNASGNCVMINGNRFIFHMHENAIITDCNIIWNYYLTPKLKYLTFWKIIDMVKKLRTKECWNLHLTFYKFCMTCSTLEMITRLLYYCSDST